MGKQNQHRVSQVYLREFGYLTPNRQWKISTLELEKTKLMHELDKLLISQKSIESVTAEYDIFDLVKVPSIKTTQFEDLNGKIETWYPKIINDIESNSRLSEFSEGILIQFIPNLLCRVEPFRQLIFSHMNSNNRLYFLKAMCAFNSDKGTSFIDKMEKLPIGSQLNHVCIMVMNHILHKLSSFHYVLISDYDNRGWITTDNPVVLDNHICHNSIFSIDTEIYFPLSKGFCVFFSHPSSKNKNNILRQFKNKSLINATEEIQEMIWERIKNNADKLVFFPSQLEGSSPLHID